MDLRSIRFKAKRLDNGEWIIGSFVVMKIPALSKTTIGIVAAGGATLHEVDPSTVCQFTGLKDSEGKELFEHDLIHFAGFNRTAEVIWSECNYAFMVVCDNKHSYWLYDVIKVCKIERIGNKFDKEK